MARDQCYDVTSYRGEESMTEEKSVLRWGGLAGILCGIISILGFVLLFAVAPPTTHGSDPLVASFPDVRVATIMYESAYLAALMLYVILLLALYRTLRGVSLAPSLFGTGLGALGVVLLTTGAIPAIAFSHISDLYHAPGATPQDQATLALVWEGIQAIFNETDAMGLALLGASFILLGIGMLRNPHFGKKIGAASIVSGLAVFAGIGWYSLSLYSDTFVLAPFSILVIVIFPLLLGWKAYRVSRAT
jgi:hypothetical protein